MFVDSFDWRMLFDQPLLQTVMFILFKLYPFARIDKL